MVDVETMNGDYQHASPVGQFRTSAGKFGCDLLELAELQGKLFKADAKTAIERSMGAAIFALIGCFSLLGCIPVLTLGIASAIAYYFEIGTWFSQLLVGGCLSLISIAMIAISLRTLSNTGGQFKRSTEELSKNMEWVKNIFGGVSPGKQIYEGRRSNG